MAVRRPDDRRSLAAALAEQGPGAGNHRAWMCGGRASPCRPADCGSPWRGLLPVPGCPLSVFPVKRGRAARTDSS